MCEALEDMKAEARAEGKSEGRLEGELLSLVKILLKLKKAFSISQIAEQLDESEERIRQILDIASKYAPDYDEQEIVKELMISLDI